MHKRFLPLSNGIPQCSPEWFALRKGRLTGSKLSGLLWLKSKDEYEEYYGIIYQGKPRPPFSAEAKKYMEYGRQHEDIALCSFLDVIPSTMGDFYAAESPFFPHNTDKSIGASPDGTYAILKEGKVCEEGVLEIKCPAKDKRPYAHWKFYYVPQTYWEMSCSGHRNVIAISWGPRNMRAWKYSWDQRYWNILSNLVDAFKRFAPYSEFKELQGDLIEASHAVVASAQNLHPGKGWKQQYKIKDMSTAKTLDSFASKDLMWARVIFKESTEWYDKNKPNGTFMVFDTTDGYILKNRDKSVEFKLKGDEEIIKSVDYYE